MNNTGLKKIMKAGVRIKVLTGMRIGGSSDSVEIGGIDQPVMRMEVTDASVITTELNNEKDKEIKILKRIPYIPGSSLKGRMRGLIELSKKWYNDNGSVKVDAEGDKELETHLKLFGSPAGNVGATRLAVSDLLPTKETLLSWIDAGLDVERELEVKPENVINRVTGKAEHPRYMERVPAGSEFKGEITLLIFDNDDEDKFKKELEEAVNLINATFIGGSGSRGYGKVSLEMDNFDIVWERS